jgi:hypothetical protein
VTAAMFIESRGVFASLSPCIAAFGVVYFPRSLLGCFQPDDDQALGHRFNGQDVDLPPRGQSPFPVEEERFVSRETQLESKGVGYKYQGVAFLFQRSVLRKQLVLS